MEFGKSTIDYLVKQNEEKALKEKMEEEELDKFINNCFEL